MEPGWPESREEELSDRRRRKALFFAAGGLVGLAGLTMSALNFALVMGGGSASLLLTPLPLLAVAGLTVWGGGRVSLQPDPELPTWEQLDPADPRRALPRAARRQRWLIVVLSWAVGWAFAGLVAVEADVRSFGWAKPLLFLALSMGPVLGGARHLRRHNGSTAWPDR
jgi:hypothetical protein